MSAAPLPLPAVRPRLLARLAVGGIAHETNTFSPVPTDLAAFREHSMLAGGALLGAARGSAGALVGAVAAADRAGATVVPTLFAAATPGGTVTREAWEHLRDGLLDRLRPSHRGPWPLAGVVLTLHGALVADDEHDAEGALLAAVRRAVGPGVPVAATLDSHANLSPAMVAAADVLLPYATYPHVDTQERGQRAAELALAVRAGQVRPVSAFRAVPLLAPLPAQRTAPGTPMGEIAALAAELGRHPRVLVAAVTGGFPYADVARAGAAVLVTTDGEPALAEALADRLAAALWARRDRFRAAGLPPGEAVELALALANERPGRPVVLADVADNPGAGAPGDGTALLAALLESGASGAALAAVPDPAAVAAAARAGAGARVRLAVGGKTDPRGGPPVELVWDVRAVADVAFADRGPVGRGARTRLGRTALLAARGVEVVVCERRVQALGPALFRAVGIEPAARCLLAVKSGVHFRAAFGPLAAAVLEVEGPGLSSSDLAAFPYRRVRRPILPLDAEGAAGGDVEGVGRA